MSGKHRYVIAISGLLLCACVGTAQLPVKPLPPPPVSRPRVETPAPAPRIPPSRPIEPKPAPAHSSPARQLAPAENNRATRTHPDYSPRAVESPRASERSSSSSGPSRLTNIYGTHTALTPARTNPAPTSGRTIAPYRPNPSIGSPLNTKDSRSVLDQANSRRMNLPGVNRRPLPKGDVTVHAGGEFSLNTPAGHRYDVRSNGTIASFRAGGQSASFSGKGRISALHTPNLDIRDGAHGEHTIVTRRPDHSTLVSTGPHAGFLEKRINAPGRGELLQRTYVADGRVQTRVYTSYRYYGLSLPHYVPAVYFAPAFYGWAYYSWAPLAFTWDWASAPWFGFYHGYFAPYLVYPSGYAWLTDFYLSNVLASSFADGKGAAPVDGEDAPEPDHAYAQADTPISPELKDAIAEEVRQQLALTNSGASGQSDLSQTELPAAIQPDHVFVVSATLEVTTAEGLACAFDLRAEIDNGLTALHDNQGRNGWPKAPASALALPPRPAMDGLPSADPAAGDLLEAQRREAAQTEASVLAMAFNGGQ